VEKIVQESFNKRIINTITHLWESFVDAIYENPRKTLWYTFAGLFISCLLCVFILTSQSQIRQETIAKVAFQNLPSEKILPLSYKEAEKEIQDKRAISVMFSKPHGATFEQVITLVGEKEQELNRSFYYYPIVYNTGTIQDKYHVDPNLITFVFFEGGKEKNRFVVSNLKNINKEIIPEINRLPMWSVGTTPTSTDSKRD